MKSRRDFLAKASSALGSAFLADMAYAQPKTINGWPSRYVTVIATSGNSGPSGNFRLYADHLQKVFGQPFVLEGVPGASGAIGLKRVLQEKSDGYTLMVSSNSALVLAPLVIRDFGISLAQFEPIALMFRFRFLLVANPDLNVRTLDELVKYAKQNPGKMNYGSPGVGTGGHLVTELMVKRTNIRAMHVPYKSVSQHLMDTVSGSLQFTFDTIGNAKGMVDSGKLIPIAVTGSTRANVAPNIPTMLELGYPGFENLFVSVGILGKRGISPAIIAALNAEISKQNEDSSIVDRLKASAYEVMPGSPQDYAASLAADHAAWSGVVKETGISA